MITFFAALTVLDALLLWILASSIGAWHTRTAAVMIALVVNIALLFAIIPSGDGKASTKAMPDDNQFLACAVDEPSAIYFWLLVDGSPRGYKQPYTALLHKTCLAARKEAGEGNPTTIRKHGPHGRGQEAPGTYHAYKLPIPLPQKTHAPA